MSKKLGVLLSMSVFVFTTIVFSDVSSAGTKSSTGYGGSKSYSSPPKTYSSRPRTYSPPPASVRPTVTRSETGYGGAARVAPTPPAAATPKSVTGYGVKTATVAPTPPPVVTPKSVTGYGSKMAAPVAAGAVAGAVVSSTAPPKDAAATAKTQAISKEQSAKAMSDYKAQQSKYKYAGSPVTAPPNVQRDVASRVTVNNYRYERGDYVSRQQRFYSSNNWVQPVYVTNFHPYYGLWNTPSMFFMMDHMHDQQYAMMYYSHRNDADMRAWRRQAEGEGETNAELRRKLAAMDQRMLAMEKQGVQADPGYVPPAMQDVALSEEALQGMTPAATVAEQPAPLPVKKAGFPWGKAIAWTFGLSCLGVLGWYFIFKRKF